MAGRRKIGPIRPILPIVLLRLRRFQQRVVYQPRAVNLHRQHGKHRAGDLSYWSERLRVNQGHIVDLPAGRENRLGHLPLDARRVALALAEKLLGQLQTLP